VDKYIIKENAVYSEPAAMLDFHCLA